MSKTSTKCEILAPCGSYDILTAAVSAGADACYLGGNKFGARAFAHNFECESIIKAIDYAHVHGVKIYLTVNTLFKNNEIEELYDYIVPLYEAGLDAVIVQDLGVFSYIKENFPDINIHCSTQMNITSVHAAELMYNLGASRVVTAREMSIKEIEGIKKKIPELEIETFVHGALCYSYSGQCLMSSMAGGRSGNRGRCAQPCRKCYGDKYVLSMKDICTLENIPELIKSGINSLKIEGRMKNEYYVASAVDAYKTLVDDYYNGSFDIENAKEYKEKLANIYNRGGFCSGYLFMHNGPEMISDKRPNNQGVNIGRVKGVSGGKVSVDLTKKIYKGDVLEIPLRDGNVIEITAGIDGYKGKNVLLNAPKTKLVKINTDVYRTRCNMLLNNINSDIISNNKRKIYIKGRFVARIGSEMKLEITSVATENEIIHLEYGGVVEESNKVNVDRQQIKEKLSQLGDTDYIFSDLVLDVDDNAFIPLGLIKKLRRDAINGFEKAIVNQYRRNLTHSIYEDNLKKLSDNSFSKKSDRFHETRKIPFKVSVTSIEQLEVIMKYDIYGIIMPIYIYNSANKNGYISRIIDKNIRIYIYTPNVVKNEFILEEYLPKDNISGIYIRNIDGYASVMNYFDRNYEIVINSSLYAYNDMAIDFIGDRFVFEIPKELNKNELLKLNSRHSELTVYEYQQVMLSAQCIKKTLESCKKQYDVQRIQDDKGNIFYGKCICDECCNLIFNGIPYCNADKINNELCNKLSIEYFRIAFTIENESETKKVMDMFMNNHIFDITKDCLDNTLGKYTSGHFNRGVD